jgi:MFS family permease
MMQEVANKCGLPLAERCPPASSGALDARRATATLFLVDGMTFGTWAALIPSFQHKFGLSAGELSWVLFGLVLGALISMPLTGQLVARVGSRSVASRAAFIFCATLLLLALAPGYATLIAAATLFGAAKGAVDVSINAQAIAVENALRKPINSSFQAFWSVGGLGVAFLLSVAMNRGFSPKILMLVMVLFLSLLAVTTVGRLLRDGPRSETPSGFSWPDPKLLRLGGLAFLALFSEGVLLDWSAVYARDVAKVSVAAAPLAFAAFAFCMAAGRFFGDLLISRLGRVPVLRLSGGLMALGVSGAALFQTWPAVLLGFATVGLGIANLVPILFSVAGRIRKDSPGPGLATVTTLGYFGFLSGPPVIGSLAAYAGLPLAFATVLIFGVVIGTAGVAIVRPSLKNL